MTPWLFRIGLFLALVSGIVSQASAVPIPIDTKAEVITDRAGFIPQRKHLAVPGKIVAVLVADAAPVLGTEGRSGPADQLCIGWNGGSYRWVYVPVKEKAIIRNLQVPLPGGKTKVYPSLSMATPETVKPLGIDALYSLVEVEVNDGNGSPANDSFVATEMTKLDGTKEYPLQVVSALADVRKRYQTHCTEIQKDLDAAMDEAATKALKNRPSTGPREKSTLMFISWMPDTERLVVRFQSRIVDGDYKYGGGIKIELPPLALPPGPVQGGVAAPPRLPNGLRYGTQFGIESGAQFEVSKHGKIVGMRILEAQPFFQELPAPPVFNPQPRRLK